MIQLNPAFYEESDNSKFSIDIMESDKDHIHLLISYSPDLSLTSILRRLKQKSTHELWNKSENTGFFQLIPMIVEALAIN